jgi:hypothetical protein
MCSEVSDVLALHGIECVTIESCYSAHDLSSLGDHISITAIDPIFVCNSVLFTLNATNVNLHCKTFKCALSSLAEVPGYLTLRYFNLSLHHFKGTSLELTDRKMLSQCPNLKSLHLRGCFNIDFPVFIKEETHL